MAYENGDALLDRASDRVTDQLRQMILSLTLAPGSLLIESDLLAQLGCSRTPLREALHRLHQENLVVAHPRRAVAVTDISIFDLQQTYEARRHLEAIIAKLAAGRIAESGLRELESILESLAALPATAPPIQVATLDMAFHRRVAVAAANRYLLDAFACIEGPACRLSVVAYSRANPLPSTVQEHAGIVEALRRRDADAASARIVEHITSAKERILRAL